MKQEMVAMLLAGGEGKRLGPLTRKTAKPAVNFGGKYRIIDFPLSNCTNSGITTVGVLTQYEPLELNRYLGIGSAWDLDRRNGGLAILPPYQAQSGKNWYEGTANAIYRNLSYIDDYNPEYVLILSGDHIYKMDYEKMLDFHKEKQADVTISVMEVPWDEAPRFGILNTSDDLRINEFDEKPEKPKSNLASMGIYIFNWKVLREHLIQDAEDETSSFDFGKNIIPNTNRFGKPTWTCSKKIHRSTFTIRTGKSIRSTRTKHRNSSGKMRVSNSRSLTKAAKSRARSNIRSCSTMYVSVKARSSKTRSSCREHGLEKM